MSLYDEIMVNLKQEARNSWKGETGEERSRQLESFLDERIGQYAEKFSIDKGELLEMFEEARDYSAINFYQEAHFPSLDNVRVFQNMAELKKSVGNLGFECPCCGGVSTDAYRCDSGLAMDKDGKICDWKAGGLFKTLGKGVNVAVVDLFLEAPTIEHIFMPIAWKEAANG